MVGGIGSAFRNRNYRIFAFGQGCAMTGLWVQRVAVGWLTWELTHSGTWLGIMAFADLAPVLVTAPLAGAVADRVDRLTLLRWTQSVAAVQGAMLTAAMFAGLLNIWLLLALTILRGTASAYAQPSRFALVPSLVGRDSVASAIAIDSSIWNVAMFVGPAVAGAIIATSGLAWAFACNTAGFLIFVLMLARIRLAADDSPPRARRRLTTDIADGIRYAVSHPAAGPLLILMLVTAVFARPVGELLPGFADRVFDRGATGLAWLTSSMGLSAFAAGTWLARRGTVTGLTTIAAAHLLVAALSLFAFVASDSFWFALAFLAVTAWAFSAINISCQTLIMTSVDGQMRGRVMSFYGLIGRSGPAAGALLMGGLSEAVGLRLPVAGGAAICVGAWLWMLRRQRGIARIIESDPQGQAGA